MYTHTHQFIPKNTVFVCLFVHVLFPFTSQHIFPDHCTHYIISLIPENCIVESTPKADACDPMLSFEGLCLLKHEQFFQYWTFVLIF